MKRKINLGIGALLLSFIMPGYQAISQETWSLERCVNHAITNNIQIKQQALNLNYNENQHKQSKFDLAPSLNGNAGYSYNFGKTLNVDNTFSNNNSQSIDFSLNSEVTLYNGMAQKNSIERWELNLDAATQDLQKAKDDISLSVVSAYLDILFNKELVNTANEQLEVTNQQIEYNQKQVEAGNLARGKLLETEAQAANEELTLTNYENQLEISKLNIMQLLELEVNGNFEIVIPEFDPNQLTVELLQSATIFNKAVTERPEILSKELMLKSMEKESAIAKAQLQPSLVAGATYFTNYNNSFSLTPGGDIIPFGDQLDNNRRGSAYLSLRIPMFNGLAAKTNYKNSMIQYENSKHELQLEKNNLLKQIQQVHANATAAMKKYYSSEKAVQSAEEAFRYVEEKFNLGIVTPLEYNDSKNKVTSAKSSFIQAKYEFIFRVKILDFYNGIPITL